VQRTVVITEDEEIGGGQHRAHVIGTRRLLPDASLSADWNILHPLQVSLKKRKKKRRACLSVLGSH
jgi:hypothetical protein